MYHHIRATTMCLLALPLVWVAGCSAQPTPAKPAGQAGQQGGQSGFTVAREGKAMSTIVLPDKALPVEIYAAEELTKHLELSTGAKLPVVREGQLKTPAQSPIYIGNVRALRQIEVAPKVEAWGGWTTVPAAGVTPIAPDTSGIVKLPDGGEMHSGSNIAPVGGAADDAIMLTIDLGQVQDVGALAVVNRHDIPTNYNIRRVKVESSAKDDGQTWDETLFEGEPTPAVNEANAVRAIPLRAVKRRYFRVSVMANFWGTLDTHENSNTQLLSWKEWRVAPPNPAAVVPANFQRLDSLEPNSFVVRTNGDALFLAGRDDAGNPLQDNVNVGTLFAVYEWLDQQAGVRWIWPGEVGTFVPKKSTLLAGTWNLRSKPSLIHARLRFGPDFGTFKAASPAVGERYMRETSAWVRRHRFGRGASFEYGHAFENYWDRFGKEHPEYFALRPDGRRGPAEDTPHGHTLVQMCVSNPALHRQIIADWLEQRKNNPSLPWVNGAENDQDALNPACTCEVCRSWDEPGSKTLADRYARFWMAL